MDNICYAAVDFGIANTTDNHTKKVHCLCNSNDKGYLIPFSFYDLQFRCILDAMKQIVILELNVLI